MRTNDDMRALSLNIIVDIFKVLQKTHFNVHKQAKKLGPLTDIYV